MATGRRLPVPPGLLNILPVHVISKPEFLHHLLPERIKLHQRIISYITVDHISGSICNPSCKDIQHMVEILSSVGLKCMATGHHIQERIGIDGFLLTVFSE